MGVVDRLRAGKTQVRLRRNNTNSIGVAHSSAPALDADNRVTGSNDLELETLVDAPLQTTIDVFLPDLDVEVWFLFGEIEWVDAAVEVGVL